VALDRLGQRYHCNPLSLLALDVLDWSLLLCIAQAGAEQDKEDMEAWHARQSGKLRAVPVTGDSRVQQAKRRKAARRKASHV
jgi:hypothetical protein